MLLEFGRNPRWLGGNIGITIVLHTWGQYLSRHIHVHCIVSGGAQSLDGECWIVGNQKFLFHSRALSRVFRGKYLEALEQVHRAGKMSWSDERGLDLYDSDPLDTLLTQLRSRD